MNPLQLKGFIETNHFITDKEKAYRIGLQRSIMEYVEQRRNFKKVPTELLEKVVSILDKVDIS